MSDCVLAASYDSAHKAIRKAWVERFGPLDTTDHLCHLCPNGNCVNLRHVYPGNPSTNARDTIAMGRHPSQRITHCPQGHEYTPENTMKRPSDRGRRCRECMKKRHREEMRHKRTSLQGATDL